MQAGYSRVGLALMLWLLSLVVQAQAAPVSVLASIRPLALLAEAIGGDRVQVSVLLPPGSSPHHFALRPSQRQAVAEADLVLWGGPALERPLTRLLRQHPGSLALVPEAEHESHAWLSPAVVALTAEQLRNALQARDPDASAYYRHRHDNFMAKLLAVEESLQHRLGPLADQPLLLDHDYLDVFWRHFGLQAPWLLRSHAERPGSARQVQTLLKAASERPGLCYLRETRSPPDRQARLLAQHTRLLERELDVLALGEYAGYVDWLDRLGNDLADCLMAAQLGRPDENAGKKKAVTASRLQGITRTTRPMTYQTRMGGRVS